MRDFLFQFVLLLTGALIGIIGTIATRPQAKKLAWGLAILLIGTSAMWFSYEFGFGLLPNEFAEEGGIIWQATFYGNKELKEPVVLQGRIRGARNGLRVDWGVDSPRFWTPADFFSAILTTTHNFNAGTYCFVVEVDDGAKLFIDGKEVRSVWWGYTPGAVYKTAVTLEEGPHLIEFQYFEEYEKASFHVSWYKGAGPECVTVGHPGVP